MTEIWKPVRGWEGLYEISTLGRLKVLPRYGHPRFRTEQIREPSRCPSHIYPRVLLSRDGKCHSKGLHIVVLEAFVGQRPAGLEACHNDGDCKNYSLSNLRWDTKSGNARDRFKHGTDGNGSKNGRAKLNNGDVFRIRTVRKTDREWAKILGVSTQTVRNARKGSNWDHVVSAPAINYGTGQKATDKQFRSAPDDWRLQAMAPGLGDR